VKSEDYRNRRLLLRVLIVESSTYSSEDIVERGKRGEKLDGLQRNPTSASEEVMTESMTARKIGRIEEVSVA